MTYPIPEQPTWKVIDPSKLKEFYSCQRKFFYRYMLGWTIDEPNIHLEFGEAWHRALAHLYANDFSESSIMGAYEQFLLHYRKFWSPEQDEINYPKCPQNAIEALVAYTVEHKEDPYKYDTVYVEIAIRVPISAERILHGRMDSILQDTQSGKYFSFEHKTGTSPHLWAEQWALDIQPTSYNHVLYCQYPEEQVRGVIVNGTFFPKKKKDWAADFMRVPAARTKRQMSDWLWEVNDKYDELELEMERLSQCSDMEPIMKAFPKNPGSCINYGRCCEYHDFCVTWSNPLQHCAQPPLGFVESHWDPSKVECQHEMIIGKEDSE